MNKTVTINLGGTIFNVEEDAFELLRSYLEKIKQNFAGDASADEIMMDIEGRIAELFVQRLNEKKNVIIRVDVEEVINVMGQPEDYGSGDGAESTATGSEYVKHDKRRIYRDQDDAYVGGVCSGLSYYLGWDPIILRIAFVILTVAGGSGIPVYIILWAVIPAAATTAEKLKMRGEPVTIDNIGKFVNKEAQRAGENIHRFGEKAKKNFSGGRNHAEGIGNVLRKILGLGLLIAGLIMLFGLLTSTFIANFEIFGFNSNFDLLNELVFQNDGTIWMLVVGGLLVALMPILSIIYAGIKLLMDRSRRVKGIGWSLFALFVIGLIMLGISGTKTARQFRRGGELKNTMAINITSGDTLFMNVEEDTVFTGRHFYDHSDFFDLVQKKDDKFIFGEPLHLHIYTCDSSETPKVVVEKYSRGANLNDAGERAERIEYNIDVDGNNINIPSLFSTPKEDVYRGQNVDVRFYLPQGTLVKFNKNVHYISWYGKYADSVQTIGTDGIQD
ncbi:MAG: PspC domain-containing protein [Flavobacteriales bacterium]